MAKRDICPRCGFGYLAYVQESRDCLTAICSHKNACQFRFPIYAKANVQPKDRYQYVLREWRRHDR